MRPIRTLRASLILCPLLIAAAQAAGSPPLSALRIPHSISGYFAYWNGLLMADRL